MYHHPVKLLEICPQLLQYSWSHISCCIECTTKEAFKLADKISMVHGT